MLVGIAWFDDECPPLEELAIRTGGLPLLPEETEWPRCPHHDTPMLFRAQIPLALTNLVPFNDPRVLQVFECHAQMDAEVCDVGAALIVKEPLGVRQPPPTSSYDVLLLHPGARKEEVYALVSRLSDDSGGILGETPQAPTIPMTLIQAAPSSVAEEAVRALTERGATAKLIPNAPTVLTPPRGGQLVVFDDGVEGMRKTTLPPLLKIQRQQQGGQIRGLLGGATPGWRDYPIDCKSCNRPSRTAVRLLDVPSDAPDTISLGMAVVQVCIRCNRGWVFRSSAQKAAAAE